MGDDRDSEKRLKALRRQIEKSISGSAGDLPVISTGDTRELIHELNTYQVELEAQNEELHRVGLSLESARAKYLELYDFAPISYLTVDESGMILELNLAASRLLGADRHKLIGQGISRFIVPEYHSLYNSCLSSATESRSSRSCDLQIVGLNGSTSHVQMGLVAMGQVAQENSQLWITLTDVTERQIFEDELAKNEREINLLLQNMVRGFVHFKTLLDGKGRTEDLIFLRINDAFERLTGLNEKNVLGRKVTEVFPNIHELEFEWIHNLGNVASTGDSAYYEKFFEPLDRWYSISTFCPEPGFCAATFADITELKKIEGSLERANEELEQRNRELEAFVYTTTHDLRTPLVSGYGFLQMLNGKISDKLDEDQKIMMENIINSFHVSDALLRDLGEFSQVESGKESIKVSSIESIIEKIKEVERGMIKITNASIKVQEDLPSILLHESRGYQLFKNLVSNSLKYARENIPLEIEIGLSTEHSEEIPSNYRVFFFKDNSIGIDQDTEDRYFGSSALNEIKDKGGPGIRLAIVKRIVELDKGKIWVDTTKQKGIVFYISLGILEEKPN